MMIDSHCRWALVAGARPNTLVARGGVLRHFAKTHPLLAAGREDIYVYLARDHLSPQSRRSYLLHLRAFYSWATLEGLIAADPTTGIPLTRVPRREPRPMPDRDLALALTAPEPLRSWFLIAALAGLRAMEIAPLRGDDLTDGWLFVREGKGGHSRKVWAHPLVQEAIISRQTAGPLWEVTPKRLTAQANRWLHANGISSTMHTARHWFGTNVLIASGGNVRTTQEALGHASVASTQVYTRISEDQVRAAIEGLPLAAA
jgi:integrase/recombinase XerC